MWLATTGDDVSADGEVRDAAWGANGSREPDCIRGPHEVNSPVVKDAMTWSGRSGAGLQLSVRDPFRIIPALVFLRIGRWRG